MKYSFDTSALINPWTKLYPKDVFPGIWECLSDAIERGHVVAHPTVIEEVAGQEEEEEEEEDGEEDELVAWVNQCEKLEFPDDETVQETASDIRNKYPKLVRATARVGADPFVIALAKQHGITVVSEEILTPSERKNEGKIPYVCEKYDVKHINFLGFMREMEWKF